MGNSISSSKYSKQISKKHSSHSIKHTINHLVAHYITTMDSDSYVQLYNREYCQKLQDVLSQIFYKHVNDQELQSLVASIYSSDIMNSPTLIKYDKHTFCIYLSMFYVKIAQLYAIIITTINPEYTYVDNNGRIMRANILSKSKLPENAKLHISKLNLCDNRIHDLVEKGVLLSENIQDDSIQENKDDDGEEEMIDSFKQPSFCEIQIENGDKYMPEWMDLYYDSEYDLNTGKFLGLSPQANQKYKDDLKLFFIHFTDNQEIPDKITRFQDIRLNQHGGMKKIWNQSMLDDIQQPITWNDHDHIDNSTCRQQLIISYANNLKQMLQNVNTRQQYLMNIIYEVFVQTQVQEPHESEDPTLRYSIHTDVTAIQLDELIEDTRDTILQLHESCEHDYLEGMYIYEAINESLMLETLQRQVIVLENKKNELIHAFDTSKS
tara:strand:+ start:7704 stop:9011 length:1308 start_codon:yes stop_codon:yes gene_type:complete